MKRYLLFILTTLFVFMTGCSKTLTDSEMAEFERKNVRKIHEYKVVSVYRYISTTTNNFGGVIRQDPKYMFTYIGDDGQLHEVYDYEHTEYGLWKVCIGEENKYVVKDGFDTYKWLYLTEDTITNMEIVDTIQ